MKAKIEENGRSPWLRGHMALLVIGAAIWLGCCFNNCLWFDESFTVGLMELDMWDMIKVSAYDVHPPLYYILLKVFTYIFGRSIPAMRVFSALGAIALCGLGWTHIRKDFGERIGFFFSFFTLTFASVTKYAHQIRMYTWLAFFVTLAAVYAYRLTVAGKDGRKNAILFVGFSVAVGYTHHYGLFTVAVINLSMLLYLLMRKKTVKGWFLNAAAEIMLFLPGLALFVYQGLRGGNNWQSIDWPNFAIDLTSTHLAALFFDLFPYLPAVLYRLLGVVFVALAALFALTLYLRVKRKDDGYIGAIGAAGVYAGVMFFVLTVSVITVIYNVRYTFAILPFLIFLTAFLVAGNKKRWQTVVTCVLIGALFLAQLVPFYQYIYDPSADAVSNYLSERTNEDDIFVMDSWEQDALDKFAVAVRLQEFEVYYFHEPNWDMEEPYQAFKANTTILSDLKTEEILSGSHRVWVIGESEAAGQLEEMGYRMLSKERIDVRYYGYGYDIMLYEKR